MLTMMEILLILINITRIVAFAVLFYKLNMNVCVCVRVSVYLCIYIIYNIIISDKYLMMILYTTTKLV